MLGPAEAGSAPAIKPATSVARKRVFEVIWSFKLLGGSSSLKVS
jgi:hypothetical protein